jgi:hypothetical protein
MSVGNVHNIQAVLTAPVRCSATGIILSSLLLLYLIGVARAYFAVGREWARLDRDVRIVFLLAVPVLRAVVAM